MSLRLGIAAPTALVANLFPPHSPIVTQQIAKKCRHVQPKLQKWIADSAESNPDAMGKVPAVFLIMR
jgi:hypothetical protein